MEVITYDSKNNHQELHDALEVLVLLVEDERKRIAKEMFPDNAVEYFVS